MDLLTGVRKKVEPKKVPAIEAGVEIDGLGMIEQTDSPFIMFCGVSAIWV